MRLQVVTPLAIMVDAEDVTVVRAEDATGAFGILPGHAEFVTTLAVSVLTWRDRAGTERRVAVRGGVLRVQHGGFVQVATPQAIGGDTLEALGPAVLDTLRRDARAESEARISAARLHVGLIRQVERYLRAGRGMVPEAGDGAARAKAAEETEAVKEPGL